jgi:hypothetical protein
MDTTPTRENGAAAPPPQGSAGAVTVHYPDEPEAFIPASDWTIYSAVLRHARGRGVRFAMSGGFTSSFYTAMWRNTKDMDLCVLPREREAMIEATREAGLHDLYDEKPYDRRWIYRATRDGVIVDTIWQLANFRGEVDEAWLERGPEITLHGEALKLVPPEEMIWSKIHIVQRERCDFPDVINLLYSTGAALDWGRLVSRLAGEERLLASVLLLFSWLAPGRARAFPEWIWPRLGIERPAAGPERDDERIALLESRPWFSPL